MVHGWDGNPKNAWFPWLKKELEKNGFVVFTPLMPKPEEPKIDKWVNYLKEDVGVPDKDTYFVGHSIGCQTILRYLERVETPVGGCVFVAGFFNLPNLETEEEKEIAKPWLSLPIDFEKVKRCTNKIVAIFSDDDPDVPIEDKELFEKHLNAKTIVEHNKGHFSDDAGITELPSALNTLLDISK